MIKPLTFPSIISIFAAIMIANAVAYWKHLYFYVRWLDIPMHIVSGFWIASTVCSFIAGSTRITKATLDRRIVFFAALGAVMTIGILWELFEFSIKGIVVFDPHDMNDTLSDLACDFLGGIAGSLFVLVARYNAGDE